MQKIRQFLIGTKTASRVLFVLWIVFSAICNFANESKLLEIFDFTVIFLFPAIVNELCKNPLFQENNTQLLQKKNTKKTPKYISKSRIASFVLFGFTVLFLIIGLSANSHTETHSANNMSPGIVFAIITVVVFIISLFSPKTKEEEVQRKQQRMEFNILET